MGKGPREVDATSEKQVQTSSNALGRTADERQIVPNLPKYKQADFRPRAPAGVREASQAMRCQPTPGTCATRPSISSAPSAALTRSGASPVRPTSASIAVVASPSATQTVP